MMVHVGSTWQSKMIPKLTFRQFLRFLLTKNDSLHIMHDTWHKSVIIRVSHATNKFKVQFKSINSSLSFYSPSCNLFAMPRNPQSLAVTVVPTLQQRLLSAIFTSTNCILSFDPTSRSLVTYYWSVLQMFAA
jgi:hypothetical protein